MEKTDYQEAVMDYAVSYLDKLLRMEDGLRWKTSQTRKTNNELTANSENSTKKSES